MGPSAPSSNTLGLVAPIASANEQIHPYHSVKIFEISYIPLILGMQKKLIPPRRSSWNKPLNVVALLRITIRQIKMP